MPLSAYTAALGACEKGSAWDMLLDIFDGAKKAGLEADVPTLRLVFAASEKAGRWEKATAILRAARKAAAEKAAAAAKAAEGVAAAKAKAAAVKEGGAEAGKEGTEAAAVAEVKADKGPIALYTAALEVSANIWEGRERWVQMQSLSV